MTTRWEEMLARHAAMPDEWQCPEHGAYGKAHSRFTCPECEASYQCARSMAHVVQARFDWWRTESGIPRRNRCAKPEHIVGHNPSTKALSQAVSSYVGNLAEHAKKGEGLVLLGPPGLGKTLALTAIINAASAAVGHCAYRVWPDVLADLKSGFNGPRDDERRDAVAGLKNLRLLALDELGVKAASDFDHAELFGLIDHRYRQRLPTLVAANTAQDGFAQAVGERVMDRLQETSPVIVLAGDSLRGVHPLEGPPAFELPTEETSVRVHSYGAWIERPLLPSAQER